MRRTTRAFCGIETASVPTPGPQALRPRRWRCGSDSSGLKRFPDRAPYPAEGNRSRHSRPSPKKRGRRGGAKPRPANLPLLSYGFGRLFGPDACINCGLPAFDGRQSDVIADAGDRHFRVTQRFGLGLPSAGHLRNQGEQFIPQRFQRLASVDDGRGIQIDVVLHLGKS